MSIDVRRPRALERFFRSFPQKERIDFASYDFAFWGADGHAGIEGVTLRDRQDDPQGLADAITEWLRGKGYCAEIVRRFIGCIEVRSNAFFGGEFGIEISRDR